MLLKSYSGKSLKMLEDELHNALLTKPDPTMAKIQDLYKEWVVLQYLAFFYLVSQWKFWH